MSPRAPGGEGTADAGPDPYVALALEAIETYVRTGGTIAGVLQNEAEGPHGGVFVSLHLPDGSLRGCLGTIVATRGTLGEEIVANALAAASQDPRFLPVAAGELKGLDVSVDVLSAPEEVEGPEELDPRRYGIIVRTQDGRQALLLPDLAGVETVDQQVRLTCRKGGIHPERDDYRLFRFTVARHQASEVGSRGVDSGV